MADQPQKILLVEDEALIADLYRANLENAGFVVKIAKDGLEAINDMKTGHYDLILLDIMLPNMNGLEVIKQCKSENLAPGVPIVLLSNLANDTTIKEGFRLGANGYLVKSSYTPLQLIPEIKNYLKGDPTNLIQSV